jgi:outer membrane lipoprotein-sorting protein
MGLGDPARAEQLRRAAERDPAQRAEFDEARRAHAALVRTYEAYDRDHDRLRDQLMAALPDRPGATADGGASGRRQRSKGAFLMRHPTTRIAAFVLTPAAAIVLAFVFILGWNQTSAFARAVERLRAATTITTRFQAWVGDAEQPMMGGKLYLSAEQGMRFDTSVSGMEGSATTVYHAIGGPITMVQEPLNAVIRIHVPDDLDAVTNVPDQTSPDAFIRKFMDLAGEADVKLGPSTIDGREVEGFEVSGERLGLSFTGAPGGGAARLWVDVKSGLPVKLEVETAHTNAMVGTMRVRAVYDQFEWDVPLDAALFTPVIPEGLREVDLTMPPISEETLIEGLRVFADTIGSYPNTLDAAWAGAQLSVSWMTKGRIQRGPDGEMPVIPAELMQDTMTIATGCGFVQQLARKGHDPEYFGAAVRPEDKDEVLVRWRLDDGRTRVIYGDLRAETLESTPDGG